MVSKFLKAEGRVLALVYWAVGRAKVAAEQTLPAHGGPQADGVTPSPPATHGPSSRDDTETQGPALMGRPGQSLVAFPWDLSPMCLQPLQGPQCESWGALPSLLWLGAPDPSAQSPAFRLNSVGGCSLASTWPRGADPTPDVSLPSPGDTIWAPSVLPDGALGTLSHHPPLHFGRKMESKVSEGGLNVTLTIRLLMHGKVRA